MKKAVFMIGLVLVGYVASFAQTGETVCPQIAIEGSKTFQKGETAFFKALFTNAPPPNSETLRWKIIKGDKITELFEQESINFETKEFEEGDSFIVLAEYEEKNCRNSAMVTASIEVSCRLPITLDSYEKLKWADEKERLGYVAFEFKKLISEQNFPIFRLFIFVKVAKDTPQRAVGERLTRLFNYLSVARKVNPNQIVFLISDAESEQTEFLILSQNLEDVFSDASLMIRGDDFPKLRNLFQSKISKKKLKN